MKGGVIAGRLEVTKPFQEPARTPVRIRISAELSKQLAATLRQAYRAGDLRLVRRVSAVLALGRGETVPSLAETLGVSPASVYGWLTTLLVEGVAGLRV